MRSVVAISWFLLSRNREFRLQEGLHHTFGRHSGYTYPIGLQIGSYTSFHSCACDQYEFDYEPREGCAIVCVNIAVPPKTIYQVMKKRRLIAVFLVIGNDELEIVANQSLQESSPLYLESFSVLPACKNTDSVSLMSGGCMKSVKSDPKRPKQR